MKRLTERFSNGQAAVAGCGSQCQHGFIYCENIPDENRCSREWSLCPTIDEIIEKLAEYEDAEEQGLLLRLPVAIGSKVWKIINQRYNFTDIPYKIVTIVNFRLDMLKEIGKTVFFTKEEAEQTLARMKGGLYGF